jgi:hypothetical protein
MIDDGLVDTQLSTWSRRMEASPGLGGGRFRVLRCVDAFAAAFRRARDRRAVACGANAHRRWVVDEFGERRLGAWACCSPAASPTRLSASSNMPAMRSAGIRARVDGGGSFPADKASLNAPRIPLENHDQGRARHQRAVFWRPGVQQGACTNLPKMCRSAISICLSRCMPAATFATL